MLPKLPKFTNQERLGRSVVSSRAAKRARTRNTIIRDVFLESEEALSLSVDRMEHAQLSVMAELCTRRASARTPPRQCQGWAVITVENAALGGRTVEATPIPEIIYHTDIFLNVDANDRRDKQKQHATELAAYASWQEAP